MQRNVILEFLTVVAISVSRQSFASLWTLDGLSIQFEQRLIDTAPGVLTADIDTLQSLQSTLTSILHQTNGNEWIKVKSEPLKLTRRAHPIFIILG